MRVDQLNAGKRRKNIRSKNTCVNYFLPDRFYPDVEFYEKQQKNNYLTDKIDRVGFRRREILLYKNLEICGHY